MTLPRGAQLARDRNGSICRHATGPTVSSLSYQSDASRCWLNITCSPETQEHSLEVCRLSEESHHHDRDHLSVLAGFRIAHATCAHVPIGLILKSQQNHSRFSCIVLGYI